MSAEELQIFESVAGAELDALGYERVAGGEKLHFSDAEIADFRAENERRKARAWDQLPVEDRERRAAQRRLLEEIAARNARRAKLTA
jgi:hypothetical protein